MLSRVLLLALAASVALSLAGPDGGGSVPPSGAGAIRGPVRVVDADTLDVGEIRVRLHGVDAPEADQPCLDARGRAFACGDAATAFARARWEGREATCEALDRDRYGRVVARCTVAGEDLGASLVSGGRAYAAIAYSRDYAPAEEAARDGGAGFFAGRFDPPWAFRAAARGEAAPRASVSGDCRIKGNVSRSGRIFHPPGSRDYDRTAIDEAAGERWFCTEAQALAAGWRAPR